MIDHVPRLTPPRSGSTIIGLAWALVAGIVIDFTAILILFGSGP